MHWYHAIVNLEFIPCPVSHHLCPCTSGRGWPWDCLGFHATRRKKWLHVIPDDSLIEELVILLLLRSYLRFSEFMNWVHTTIIHYVMRILYICAHSIQWTCCNFKSWQAWLIIICITFFAAGIVCQTYLNMVKTYGAFHDSESTRNMVIKYSGGLALRIFNF